MSSGVKSYEYRKRTTRQTSQPVVVARTAQSGALHASAGSQRRVHRDRLFPEGTALQLVLKTIDSAQQEIRLMGYSFTSPEVTRSLIAAKRRGVDIRVVLDQKANTGKASVAAMNVLVSAGIPVRTVDVYTILHDKVIVADKRNTEVGSFNFSRAADRSNSENVLVVWDDPVVAHSYLNHWASRWAQGTDWQSTY
jgi:phosphatidylserine/phosphatidylglycerophosphate/cardiolipin synthase-like enzyme